MGTLKELCDRFYLAQLNDRTAEVWPEFEPAFHALGAYAEAARGGRGMDTKCDDPDRRAVLRTAREWAAALPASVLLELHACPTFMGRQAIRARVRREEENRQRREEVAAAIARVKETEEREAAEEKRRAEVKAERELDREYKKAVIAQAKAGKPRGRGRPPKPEQDRIADETFLAEWEAFSEEEERKGKRTVRYAAFGKTRPKPMEGKQVRSIVERARSQRKRAKGRRI